MSDSSSKRTLTEISHLFLSSVRDRQTGQAPRPTRRPPQAHVSIDLTPEEFAEVFSLCVEVLEKAKDESAHLKNLFCRYSDALLAQVMQSVACNAFHPIEARAARWLLHAQDRAGSDRLELTQESLAGLLGVQRTSVNAAAGMLQKAAALRFVRGRARILKAETLGRHACACAWSA